MKKAEGRRKISGAALLVCLAVVVNSLVFAGRPAFVSGKSSNIAQAAASDPKGQPEPVSVRKKRVASVVIGRLGYVLYDDGTATVTDEAAVMEGLEAKAVDIIIPSKVSYGGKSYTVTTIGQKCFYSGGDNEHFYGRIVLPDTIQTIEKGAFCQVNCEKLVVPDSVTKVESYGFYKLTVKQDFYYPSGCTEIPKGALYELTVRDGILVIPETITKLGERAVSTFSPVRILCDPDEIGSGAFVKLPSDKIEIGGRQGFVLEDGMLLNKDKTELIKYLKPTSSDIVIPDTIQRIHAYAFENVDTYAFQQEQEKKELTFRVYLPEGLTELETGTFSGCYWLDTLYLPASLEKIADRTFAEARLGVVQTLVFQSAKPPEIGKENKVGGVRLESEEANPEEFKASFKGKLQYGQLYEISSKKEKSGSFDSGNHDDKDSSDYRQDRFREQVLTNDKPQIDDKYQIGQPEEENRIVLDNILYTLYLNGTAEVTQVGADKSDPYGYTPDEVYDYDRLHEQFDYDLGDICIPKKIQANGKNYTVTSIGAKAFVGSFRYGKITLPDTIAYVGDYAFYQRRIKEISLPDSITEMGIGVFEQAELEGELVFPASMDTVPYRTFYRTVVWQRLVLPDTVTRLERYAVMLDRYPIEAGVLIPGKTEVVLSKNLKEAGECAFYASPNYCLVKLTGKDGNVIEDGMLFNKSKTELILALEPKTGDYYIPKTVRRIHAYAFSAVSQGVDPANGATGRIWVPEGVKLLEKGTFRNCFWLKSLNLPSTIERIETGAWSCISLEEPNAGKGLQNLIIKAKKPPEIEGKQKILRNINVPNSSISKYKKALAGKIGYKKLY